MQITRKEFTRVMIEYGFARFPRMVGSPSQSVIYPNNNDNGFSTFINFFKLNNGTRPVFTSHNSYYDFDEYGNPTNIYYEKLFQDLDTDNKGTTLENAHEDCKKVAEFTIENKMPFICSFSGNGFQIMVVFNH